MHKDKQIKEPGKNATCGFKEDWKQSSVPAAAGKHGLPESNS